MPDAGRKCTLPDGGIWRIGRGDDPLRYPVRGGMQLDDTRAGNRFDSLTGRFSVLYFGTTQESCFGETLSRYRRDPKLAFIEDEWQQNGFMDYGSVPRDWRTRRTAVRIQLAEKEEFFNVEDLDNLALLQRELAPALALYGVDELDNVSLRGPDRRTTRTISEWVWQQVDEDGAALFAGVRYRSRIYTGWECWAVFDDVSLDELERQPILMDNEAMSSVAHRFDLAIH